MRPLTLRVGKIVRPGRWEMTAFSRNLTGPRAEHYDTEGLDRDASRKRLEDKFGVPEIPQVILKRSSPLESFIGISTPLLRLLMPLPAVEAGAEP